jgi:transposase-like protein
MTLPELIELFPTDEKCRELLERLRWPNGPECPRCKTQKVVRLSTNIKLLWCAECNYQFSVTAGTIFNDSHLELNKWFLATLLLCEAKKGMSAHQLKRTIWGLHKGSYKTAWYLCHRIRAAMIAVDKPALGGTVEIDETFVGGKQRGHQHKVGHPDCKKEVVLAIRQRGGDVRFFHAGDVRVGTLEAFIKDNVAEDVDVIVTDEYGAYPPAMGGFKAKHKTIKHKAGIYVDPTDATIHTNTVENAFSLLKRGIIGTWHRISAKHLHAYLAEMEFRFNRRDRSDLFLDTLRHMVTADPLTFQQLTS